MSLLRNLAAFALENVREVLFLVGLGLVSTGLALVYLPAALIVAGSLLLWLAIPSVGGRPQ